MKRRWTLAFGALGLLLASGVATAHGVTTRFDAPIPLAHLYAGAGATVALTALFLTASVGDATLPARRVDLLAPDAGRVVRVAARLLFLGAFVGAVVAGVTGPSNPADNFAIAFTWAVWLKGVGLLAALFGSPWRTLSPWHTVYDGLSALEGDDVALAEYPGWLGDWPALVGFVALVGITENLTRIPVDPQLTAALLVGYALVMLLGGVAFGPTWFERGDPLSVLYQLFGRVAPFRVRRTASGYALDLRAPWRDCTDPVRSMTVAAFVVAAVYTVSFDGFMEAPEYQTLLFDARDAVGLGPTTSVPLYFAGFVAFLAAFGVVGAATRFVTDRDEANASWRGTLLAFAPTIVPIAVAYELAHNFYFVVLRSARIVSIVGGPETEPLAWLSLSAYWTTQVGLVVGGHVVAVVAAHRVLRARYDRAGLAHVPLTALMVGYTVLSLWIISRPVAT